MISFPMPETESVAHPPEHAAATAALRHANRPAAEAARKPVEIAMGQREEVRLSR